MVTWSLGTLSPGLHAPKAEAGRAAGGSSLAREVGVRDARKLERGRGEKFQTGRLTWMANVMDDTKRDGLEWDDRGGSGSGGLARRGGG